MEINDIISKIEKAFPAEKLRGMSIRDIDFMDGWGKDPMFDGFPEEKDDWHKIADEDTGLFINGGVFTYGGEDSLRFYLPALMIYVLKNPDCHMARESSAYWLTNPRIENTQPSGDNVPISLEEMIQVMGFDKQRLEAIILFLEYMWEWEFSYFGHDDEDVKNRYANIEELKKLHTNISL